MHQQFPFQARARVCVNQPHVVCGEPFYDSETFITIFLRKVVDTD
jgi:hypothetical protein